MEMTLPRVVLLATILQPGVLSSWNSLTGGAETGPAYSDLADVVADFCGGPFEVTLVYDDEGIVMAAACVANAVDLSLERSGNLSLNHTVPQSSWARDAQRKFKILLANASQDTVDRLLEPLSPLKAQISAVCHLALPENWTLGKFVEPLVPFRSLNCCRALNIGFGPPDVRPELIAVEQRAVGGVTLLLYAASDSSIACTYCGLMQRRNDHFEYLPGLSGAHVFVSARNNTPYVVVGKQGHDGEFKFQKGVEIFLLKAISQRLNFTLDSHLALSEISFTWQRTEVISYLYPVLYDVLSYATKAPRVIPFTMAIIKPFSEDIWGLLVLAISMSTAFLFCLRWSPANRAHRHRPDFWFLLSTLSRQNPWEEEHASAGYRVFLGPWWLFVTVLTTLYSGRLVAIMSVAVHDSWINNLDALEKALARREVRVCTHSKTIFIEYIKLAGSGSFYQARMNQLERDGAHTVLVSDRKTGLERVLYQDYVYVDSRLSLLTGLELVGEQAAPLLRVVRDHLGVEYCGFVFQKGCPLKHTFTASYSNKGAASPKLKHGTFRLCRSRALFETGHIHRWMSDTLRYTLPAYLDPDTLANYDADVWKTTNDQGALNIIDFVGPAWLLAAGYAMGLAALILEHVSVSTRRRWRRWLQCRQVRRVRHSGALPQRAEGRVPHDFVINRNEASCPDWSRATA
ncbi:hypothetical protein HPB50_004522 [Hyalomma asiaticum]|uniref:Uncharacterized protein n=1 Tax=Hyalomma asiaticum TaxID=266040 RepID=A0ACB7RSN3_HYAAI|nr:hypothetical protein HPB50_004522 [Hyalomma asiaticum]